MASITVDQLQVLITANAKDLDAKLAQVQRQLQGTSTSAAAAGNVMTNAFDKVAGVAKTALKIGVAGGLAAITASIPGAVKRIDTLNNSARTFENMGFKTEDAKTAMKNLEASIMGLPTPLDSAVRGMTGLAATYGDVQLGQKVFTSLNNAILGFGGTAAEVDGAIQQLSQLPMDGPLDAQTWNSLRNSGLTPVLVAMAKESGMSVSKMKEAFGNGELTVKDFTDKLIEMNEKGGGGLKSLATIAKDSTKGIGTTFANMRTAIVRSMANLIEAIGTDNINSAIESIGKAITGVVDAARLLFTGDFDRKMFGGQFEEDSGLVSGILTVREAIVNLFDFIKNNKDVLTAVGVSLGVLVAGFKAWQVATKTAIAVQAAFNAVLALNPIGLVVIAIAALVAGLVYFFTQTETGRKAWESFTTFLSEAWTAVSTLAVTVWQTVKDAIMGAVDGVIEAYTSVKDTLIETFTTIKDEIGLAFESIKLWIEEHQTALINWGIVITTLLLPKIAQIGITFAIAAAQAVAAFAVMVAQAAVQFATIAANAVKNAITTSVAWVTSSAQSLAAWVASLPKMIATFVAMAAAAVKNALVAGAAWVAQAIRTAAGWAVTFAAYLAGVSLAAARTLIAGAQMAAAWLLAMGPIGIIVALAIGAAALIIANWETAKSFFIVAWNKIKQVAVDAWEGIKTKWQEIKTWFSNIDLAASGKALIDGLIGGITSGFNKAKDLVEGKLEDLRGLFPFSPAKEGPFSGMGYTTHSGKALIGDFAKGIGNNAAKARLAAMKAMSGVQDVMSADYSKDLANVSVGNFDSSVNVQHGFSDFSNGEKQPLIINVGGERLVDTVIEGINGRSFLGGSSVINV